MEDTEGMDGEGCQDKYQIKDCQGNQQSIEGVLPQLPNMLYIILQEFCINLWSDSNFPYLMHFAKC